MQRRLMMLGVVAALVLGASAPAAQAGGTESVSGTWSSVSDLSLSCASPILLCRNGVLKNADGVQVATFHFVMESLLPQPDGTLKFTGYEVQTYTDGSTITADDEGIVELAVLEPFPVDVTITITGGTGVYAGATGELTAVGSLDLLTDSASGTYEGTITRP